MNFPLNGTCTNVYAAPITVVVSTRCFIVLVRVGLYFLLNENRANVYAHVVVVREHVWNMLCSDGATGARVAQSFLSNS